MMFGSDVRVLFVVVEADVGGDSDGVGSGVNQVSVLVGDTMIGECKWVGVETVKIFRVNIALV